MIPVDFKRLRRMGWFTVSKAALRSRRRRMVREPESEESRRSLVTLRRAVLVLWLAGTLSTAAAMLN